MSAYKAYKDWGEQKLVIDSVEPTHYVRNFLVLSTIKNLSRKYKIRNICELGCGVGILSSRLAVCGFKVDAFDLDKYAVKLAKKFNKGKNVSFFIKNILALKSNKKYDLVLAVEVIEHIKKDVQAIEKITNILKPHGFLLITVPINEKYRREFDNRSGHVRRYSESDLKSKLEKNGFIIIKTKYFSFPLLWLWYFYFYLPYSARKSIRKEKKLPFYVHLLKIFNKVFLADLLFNSKKATNIMVLAQKTN
ncbi:class I SAM-dependent methyltransferase [Candidatus Woesearchaeota archaeon]|nr:class I SAM-dependent methyltransferase [Candidatus Woesearchaeota archaeon]